jgi:hypothetical protein
MREALQWTSHEANDAHKKANDDGSAGLPEGWCLLSEAPLATHYRVNKIHETEQCEDSEDKAKIQCVFLKWRQPFDAVWMHDVHVQLNHIESSEKGPHWLSPTH